jgi:hypothetical protein
LTNRARPFVRQQFIDGLEDQFPDRLTVEVTLRHQFVRFHCRMDRRVLTVLVNEEFGRAEDVEVRGHNLGYLSRTLLHPPQLSRLGTICCGRR